MDIFILRKYELIGILAISILLFVVGCKGIYQSQTTVMGAEIVINPMSGYEPVTARIGVITHRQNISQSAEVKRMENSIAMYNVDLMQMEGDVHGKMIAEGTKASQKE